MRDYKIYDELCKDTSQNHVHAVSLERRKKRTKKRRGKRLLVKEREKLRKLVRKCQSIMYSSIHSKTQ